MTAIPLLSGITGSEAGEFITTVPLNLEPVIVDSKISKGQLRAYPGALQRGTGPGFDRGGIFWNGRHYRVMGTSLCGIDADWMITPLGDVGVGGRCWFDYSFDRLAVGSGTNMFYYAPDSGLTQVTDEDLGPVIDGIWIDSYFMMTDGTYVLVTELNDPMQIKPLKYGSAEEDPDPINGLLKYRDEAYVLGRYTIQIFQNIGGNGFPFATELRATIPFGCVGTAAKCRFSDGFAFVGSARGEGLNVYIASEGSSASPVGSREICDALDRLADPSVVEVEARSDRGETRLIVHLPDQSWIFFLKGSEAAGQPLWLRLKTDANGYRCRNAVEAYGKVIVGDSLSGAFGDLTRTDPRHFGIEVPWQFEAGLLYNEGVGAIVHSLELVGLPGRGGSGAVFLSMSRDGETWGVERSVKLISANRSRRLQWRPHARIGNYLGLRFRGVGTSLPGIAALEAKLTALTS